MKRLLHIQFLLVLLLALGYSPLQAKRITQWQAQQQAYSFWGKQMPQKAKAKSRTATTASPSDAYYVFNNDAGGFALSQVMMPLRQYWVIPQRDHSMPRICLTD